jgi:hypothetical protein
LEVLRAVLERCYDNAMPEDGPLKLKNPADQA